MENKWGLIFIGGSQKRYEECVSAEKETMTSSMNTMTVYSVWEQKAKIGYYCSCVIGIKTRLHERHRREKE